SKSVPIFSRKSAVERKPRGKTCALLLAHNHKETLLPAVGTIDGVGSLYDFYRLDVRHGTARTIPGDAVDTGSLGARAWLVGGRLSARRFCGDAVAAEARFRRRLVAGTRKRAALSRLRHDLERGTHVPRPCRARPANRGRRNPLARRHARA